MGRSRKRNVLRLTSQQKDDLLFIVHQINHYIDIDKLYQPFLSKRNGYMLFMGEESYAYKAQLEYLFHETDLKKEKVFIMYVLLRLEPLLSNYKSDHCGKYVKMALQIQPENAYFNYRNEMILI